MLTLFFLWLCDRRVCLQYGLSFLDGRLSQAIRNQPDWQRLTGYLQEVVSPQAEIINQEIQALGSCLQGLGDRQLLGLKIPQQFGGSGFSTIEYSLANTAIARVSGILAFLQTQHQSAGGMIARFGSVSQQEFLPKMVTGELKIGVGFSHLRRQGKPIVRVIAATNGYLLTGTIPWITGYGFFQKAIAGATLPNGDELYGFIPLKNAQQSTGGSIDCGEPLQLAAMGMSQTVAVKLDQWFLAAEDVLVLKPAGSIQKGDRQNVLKHGFFALGCAYGSLDFLQTKLDESQFQLLQTRLDDLKSQIISALEKENPDFDEQLSLRIKVVAIAQEFSQLALMSSGGGGNVKTHPAQRLYREALMFSIFGQTQTIRNATLQTLIR